MLRTSTPSRPSLLEDLLETMSVVTSMRKKMAISVVLMVGTTVVSGCWKYNFTKLHTDLTPAQVYEMLEPEVQLGATEASVEQVMDRYYVLKLDEELVTDSGGSAVAYYLRPPGWSLRGPMLKGGAPGVGERYFFVFDESGRLIAIHNQGTSDFPPEVRYGSVRYPPSQYKQD